MRFDILLLAAGLALATLAHGQLADLDPDWKEVEVPPPPAFRTDQLIGLEMPRHLSTQFGVDPQTIRITNDGVVRYVMVATSSGGSNVAMYEGIRCLTGEVKTYARFGSSGQWSQVPNGQWRALNGGPSSAHALALARQGACDGRAATAASAAAIIRKLKTKPPDGSQL
jgi:hypothetical protein